MSVYRRRRAAAGFTLFELLIVVLLLAVLVGIGFSNFFKSSENSKADAAAALLVQLVHANHMYALDHQGQYLSGALASGCGPCNQAAPTVCNLVACQYVAPQDFSQLPYAFTLNGAAGGNATRLKGSGVYADWGYSAAQNGQLTALGGAPLPAKQ